MLIVSVVLYCLVALGLAFMGYKYITTAPPIDYHAEILSDGPVSDNTNLILGALYKVLGGCFLALGAGTLIIALSGVRADMAGAKFALLAMSGIAGYFATNVPQKVESHTNVKTPWRIAAGLSILSLVAFVFSVL